MACAVLALMWSAFTPTVLKPRAEHEAEGALAGGSVLYAGSFNPVHSGHIDLLQQ
ncbi:MAG: hypothetical protein SGPRY_013769, partial [Prymnesium sp.]